MKYILLCDVLHDGTKQTYTIEVNFMKKILPLHIQWMHSAISYPIPVQSILYHL